MKLRYLAVALLLCLSVFATAPVQETGLLRHPPVARDLVAFECGGDLWVVSRNGGADRRVDARVMTLEVGQSSAVRATTAEPAAWAKKAVRDRAT